MKIRTNAKRKLACIKANKKYVWLIAPLLARAAVIKERNDRIKAQVAEMFP